MEPLPDRLPLIIGVTGHRDLRLSDVPELEQQVASIIEALRRDYLGNDNEVPIIILSALAEGADRLVARVGLAHGARLIAALPLPVDEYRRDFDPGIVPGNMSEFDELLERAMAVPVMPFGSGNSLEAVRTDADQRRAQYRAAGKFIAKHCNVLIALWDGDDKSGAAGGTAEVVRFKREGFALSLSGSVRASLDTSEIGPVIHVMTPRQNAQKHENDPASSVSVAPWGQALVRYHRGGLIRQLTSGAEEFVASLSGHIRPDPRAALGKPERRNLEAWETFEALAALSRNFNREAAALESSSAESDQIAISLRDLIVPANTKPDADIEAVRKHVGEKAGRWCRLYAIADALARDRQRQVRQDWLTVYALGFVAFLCFALFSLAGAGSNLILLIYCFAFVAIFAMFGRAHAGKHQVHFLDYRALAEALRVAVFFRLAGIGAIADAYPIMQPSELGWVKTCLNALALVQSSQEPISTGERPASAGDPDSTSETIVREFWVKGQQAYFAKGTMRHKAFAEKLENIALVLLAVSPFLIVPMVIAFTSAGRGGSASILREVLLLVSGLLPGLGTALNGYSEKLALKAQARQYDRMRMLFERALVLLPERADAQTAPQIRALYSELGTEALKEQAEWVAIYRQRPIEPPK